MTRRQALVLFGASAVATVGVPVGWSAYSAMRFPSPQTPEGAYLRIVIALNKGKERDVFSYLEAEAQAAICTIHEYRAKSLVIIRASFQEPERSEWVETYREEGDADGPAGLWTHLATRLGWTTRLRTDLSGIAEIERVGPRATVVTSRGTRYPFREAASGLWGLSLFTAELMARKERAPHDFVLVEKAASDYERARR